jgi:hypothetical protein
VVMGPNVGESQGDRHHLGSDTYLVSAPIWCLTPIGV